MLSSRFSQDYINYDFVSEFHRRWFPRDSFFFFLAVSESDASTLKTMIRRTNHQFAR